MKTLHYQVLGDENRHKTVVILLHGLFGMSDNLLGLARELAPDFYVVVLDLINHGHSPHRELMDYPSMAADVFRLMDELGIWQACVLGHSMGGKVAMQMAGDHPGRVEKLVVADIAPVDYPPRHLDILRAMQAIASIPINARKEADAILQKNIAEPQLRQFFLKNMYRNDNGLWQWRFGLQEIGAAYAAICAAPAMSAVFHGDTLFIKGELSDYLLPEYEQLVRYWFPQARLKVVQGAGHWLHAEKPAIFHRLVRQFLVKA